MKHYPEYKESGVGWIGKIPKHWQVRRNKRIFNERDNRSATGKEELLTVSHITGVSPRAEKNVGMFLAETLEGYKHCSVGNLVINTMWAWMGALGISEFDGIVSPSYNVYQLKNGEYLPKYYDYLYRTPNHVSEIIRWSKGIWHSRLRLYPDAFFSMFTITPPFSEQTQIANFLNCKTGQIDELIRIKERQIELLHEQRTALINQAVTKGLDPNVEMKPSGVEWIGQIPKHWTVTRLKYISNIPVAYGLNIESDKYTTEGFRLIRITDIDGHGSLRQKGVYLSEDCVPQEQILNSYDLLLSRSGATVGKSYLHLEDGKYTSAGYLVRFNFGDYYASKFIYYVTLSHFYRNWLEQQIIISTIQNVNGEKYSNFQIPISSHQEQTQIVNFLDCKTERIDELISTEQRKIDLLKEYRQSLISEAVTGKIDVRNEV